MSAIQINSASDACVPIERKKAIVPFKLMENQMPGLEKESLGTVPFALENVFILDQRRVDEGNAELAKQIAAERSGQGKNEAFTLFTVDTVVHLLHQWRQQMPRVKPFYAVKCNNDLVLVATLAKMKAVHPNAEMVLRIDVTDASATRPLDIKFGCHPIQDAPRLLAVARQMEMEIVGISFHVGSGCQNPYVYREAIGMARNLFRMGEELGHRMRVLDLGGGFPGCEEEKQFFEEVSKVICEALDEFFPAEQFPISSGPQRKISADSGIGFDEEDEKAQFNENILENQPQNELEIIAEPGRYFASSPSSVCANVIGATRVNVQKLTKKTEDSDEAKDAFMYYLDDGVYGSFSCLSSHLFTKVPNGKPLFPRNDAEEFLSVVWGPTCDSRDQVEQLCPKPRLVPGDWLFYSDMGAYTRVTATHFNGFTRPKDVYYVVGKQIWDYLNCLQQSKNNQEEMEIRLRG